jgi:uncharacterized repeat protein (TIGR03803 family)
MGTGNLFGITPLGGANGFGTVFEISPPTQGEGTWTENIIQSFSGNPCTVCSPSAGVAIDKSGNIYGTAQGGTSSLGVVYELSPPPVAGGAWTESIIYNFAYYNGGTTGKGPGGVALVRGNLYITTQYGGPSSRGSNGNGNVLELKPPVQAGGAWLAKQIFAFDGGSGGGAPLYQGGTLIADAKGNLYGTAGGGARPGAVTAFELSPPFTGNGLWTETVLSYLDSYTVGPLVIDPAGNLYGTTSSSQNGESGTAFELVPPAFAGQSWTALTLYNFTSSSPQNGWSIFAGLILDKVGNLYGTTAGGGTSTACGNNGCGTVFELTPSTSLPWTETVLHSFSDNLRDGEGPISSLTMDPGGRLYGVTLKGGTYNAGTAFEVVP